MNWSGLILNELPGHSKSMYWSDRCFQLKEQEGIRTSTENSKKDRRDREIEIREGGVGKKSMGAAVTVAPNTVGENQ